MNYIDVEMEVYVRKYDVDIDRLKGLWFTLKTLIGIDTDEFDIQVTEFEAKGGNYDMRNRIYVGSTSPTLTAGCEKNLYLIVK